MEQPGIQSLYYVRSYVKDQLKIINIVYRTTKKKSTFTNKKKYLKMWITKKHWNANCLKTNKFIKLKCINLLTMGTFNRFLVLNQFCMDKIKYWWNIFSSPNKSMVVISTTNFLTIIKTSVYMFIFLLLLNHI